MNREEILRKSQNTFKGRDPFELHLQNVGYLLGYLILVVYALVLCIIQYCLRGESNVGLVASSFIIIATQDLFVGIWIRNKKRIVKGIFWSAMAIVGIVQYLITVFGA